MSQGLRRLSVLFYVVGCALLLGVFVTAIVVSDSDLGEGGARQFWLTLLAGLAAALPYFGFGAILSALAVLVPEPTRAVSVRLGRPEPLGVTVDEVLDGPGSIALKRRILDQLLAAGEITQSRYDGALADPRLTGAPAR